jgi:hypothetical protein
MPPDSRKNEELRVETDFDSVAISTHLERIRAMAGGKTFKRDQKRRKEMARKLKQEEKMRKRLARKEEKKEGGEEDDFDEVEPAAEPDTI